MDPKIHGLLLALIFGVSAPIQAEDPAPRFEGKTPQDWARIQRRDLAAFQSAVDAFGVAATKEWASLLAPGHTDDERFAAIDALRISLRSDEMRRTRTVAETIAVPALLPLLREPRAFVRARTMKALESIGPPASAAVPELIRIFKSTDDPDAGRFSLREVAASALGSIATPSDEIVPVLVEALRDDKDLKVRIASVHALEAMAWHATAAIGPLTEAMTRAAASGTANSEFAKAVDKALVALRRPAPPGVGAPLPPVELPALDDSGDFRLDQLKGAVSIVEFWATTCPPCQPSMAHLQQIAIAHPEWSGKVAFVGISRDEMPAVAHRHALKKGWNALKLLSDDTGRAQELFRAVLPTLIIADREGKIVWRGHPSEIDLIAEIERLLPK